MMAHDVSLSCPFRRRRRLLRITYCTTHACEWQGWPPTIISSSPYARCHYISRPTFDPITPRSCVFSCFSASRYTRSPSTAEGNKKKKKKKGTTRTTQKVLRLGEGEIFNVDSYTPQWCVDNNTVYGLKCSFWTRLGDFVAVAVNKITICKSGILVYNQIFTRTTRLTLNPRHRSVLDWVDFRYFNKNEFQILILRVYYLLILRCQIFDRGAWKLHAGMLKKFISNF